MGANGAIGGIQPFAELAQGATTVVYKGYQRALDRFVLLKVLRPEYSLDAELVQQFEAEARLLAKVQHPNVVALYAYGQQDARTYLAAEFVEGVSLRDLLQTGPLPWPLAVFVLYKAAQGLAAAHEKGILHRDLKPSNLMVAQDGQVKLTDFGFASLAAPDDGLEVRGTPAYLAPEQVLGQPASPTTDLFALGVTFFEMLTGTPAFTGDTLSHLFDAVVHDDPALAGDLPAAVRVVAARLLEKTPTARYPNTAALLADLAPLHRSYPVGEADLAAYLADPATFVQSPAVPEEAAPAATAVPPAPTAPRRRWLRHPVVLGGVVVLLIGLTGLFLWGPSVSEGDRSLQGWPFSLSRTDHASPATRPATVPDSAQMTPADVLPLSSVADSGRVPSLSSGAATVAPPPPPAPRLREPVLPEVAHGIGTLRIDSSPWAVVYVDGDSMGSTPLTLTLAAGTRQLRLRHPDFPEHQSNLDIHSGEADTLSVSFWRMVGQVSLEVSPWAQVYIDGVLRDTTPLDRPLILRPGTYTLRLEHPDLGHLERALTVAAGTTQTLRFNLNEQIP
jgi:serine/threonine-protein kinase